jgi:hypothetical protein
VVLLSAVRARVRTTREVDGDDIRSLAFTTDHDAWGSAT